MLRPFSWLHWDEVLSTVHLYKLGKSERKAKKCGQYKKYSPAQCSAIGRYSSVHGTAATAKYFSKLWGCKISDSTVNSKKKAYLDELRKRPRSDDGGNSEITAPPPKKRGRKVLLGEDLDMKVQICLRKVRGGEDTVSARIALAAVRCNKCRTSVSPVI